MKTLLEILLLLGFLLLFAEPFLFVLNSRRFFAGVLRLWALAWVFSLYNLGLVAFFAVIGGLPDCEMQLFQGPPPGPYLVLLFFGWLPGFATACVALMASTLMQGFCPSRLARITDVYRKLGTHQWFVLKNPNRPASLNGDVERYGSAYITGESPSTGSRACTSILKTAVFRRRLRPLIVAVLIGCLVLTWVALWWSDASKAARACSLARLAPLPKGAELLDADGIDGFFSATYRFAFKADAAAIDRWLAQSPGLSGVEPLVLTSDHTMIAVTTEELEAWETAHPRGVLITRDMTPSEWMEHGPYDEVHYWFSVSPRMEWFRPNVQDGRVYDVPPDRKANRGVVIVDDAKGVVWVSASHS